MLYRVPENAETFTERFNRLTAGLETHELVGIMRVDGRIVARLRGGQQQSLKLDQGLRLAKYLGVSPWVFIGESEPVTPPAAPPYGDGTEPLARQVRDLVLAAIEPLEAEVRRLRAKIEPARAPAKPRKRSA